MGGGGGGTYGEGGGQRGFGTLLPFRKHTGWQGSQENQSSEKVNEHTNAHTHTHTHRHVCDCRSELPSSNLRFFFLKLELHMKEETEDIRIGWSFLSEPGVAITVQPKAPGEVRPHADSPMGVCANVCGS